VAFLAITFLIYIPMIIYLAYPLYRARKGLILQKRHSDMTLWAIYALIVHVAMLSVCQLMIWRSTQSIDDPNATAGYKLLFCVTMITLLFGTHIFFTSFTVRLWLNYYDIQYNHVILSTEWKHIIDEQLSVKNSFWVKYRTSLGNKRFHKRLIWISTIVLTLIALSIIIVDITTSHGLSNVTTLWVILLVVDVFGFIFLSCFMYFKLRNVKFFDDFLIWNEFERFFQVLILGVVILLIMPTIYAVAVVAFPDLNLQKDETLTVLIFMYGFNAYIILYIMVEYVITRYIIHDLQNDPNLQLQYGESIRELATSKDGDSDVVQIRIHSESSAAGPEFFDHPDPDSLRTNIKVELSLKRVLSKDDYMESFMQHLSQELSMECLLSLIEFLQFRAAAQVRDIHGNLKKNKLSVNIDQEFGDWVLPKHVPTSTIVTESSCAREMAQRLFEKYIAEGADYEVNISHRLRIRLVHIFQNESGFLRTITSIGRKFQESDLTAAESGPLGVKGLPFVFDPCISEMLLLLNYSFVRWKTKGGAAFERLMKAESGHHSPRQHSPMQYPQHPMQVMQH